MISNHFLAQKTFSQSFPSRPLRQQRLSAPPPLRKAKGGVGGESFNTKRSRKTVAGQQQSCLSARLSCIRVLLLSTCNARTKLQRKKCGVRGALTVVELLSLSRLSQYLILSRSHNKYVQRVSLISPRKLIETIAFPALHYCAFPSFMST